MKTNSPGCGCCLKKYNIEKLNVDTGRTIWKRPWPKDPHVEDPDFPYLTGWAREIRTLSDGSFALSGMRYFYRINDSASSQFWRDTESVGPEQDGQNNHISIYHGETVSGDILTDLIYTGGDSLISCIDAYDAVVWQDVGNHLEHPSVKYFDEAVYCMLGQRFYKFDFLTGERLIEDYNGFGTYDFDNGHGPEVPPGIILQDAGPDGVLYMFSSDCLMTDHNGDRTALFYCHPAPFGFGTAVHCCLGNDGYVYGVEHYRAYKLDASLNVIWMVDNLSDVIVSNSPPNFGIQQMPNGNIVIAGGGFYLPQHDGDDPDDPDTEKENKNVLCLDPSDGAIIWTHVMEFAERLPDDTEFIFKYGLTVSHDGHPVVTNEMVTF